MAAELLELTNADRAFYPTLGPFLANREVHKTLGDVPWDDDTKTWFVLKNKKRILGFVAVATRGQRTIIESLYITNPEHRRVATELVGHAAQRFGKDRTLHATVRHSMAYAYQAAEFEATEKLKNFSKLTRPATRKETARA